MITKLLAALLFVSLFTGCASKFPNPSLDASQDKQLTASQIFDRTFNVHGGEKLDQLNDVNLSISGQWKRLITRIQPLVTDFTYRVDSQERLFPSSGGYVALYNGPSGTKKVFRTPQSLEVYYNQQQSNDVEVLSSTALTADAFHLFLLGPLVLQKWRDEFTRLTDISYEGSDYHRLHLYRTPGFGYAEQDQVVLWVDTNSGRTKMIQITLEGHSTTKGAHVEVEFLDYIQLDDYLFPSKFFERVNAPIAIDAHAWHLTGLDINRGNNINIYQGAEVSAIANYPASPLK